MELALNNYYGLEELTDFEIMTVDGGGIVGCAVCTTVGAVGGACTGLIAGAASGATVGALCTGGNPVAASVGAGIGAVVGTVGGTCTGAIVGCTLYVAMTKK